MSIFSIGVSGLNSAQIALKTTSNNISNVYTPGYNRELTLFNERQVGGGTEVSDIQRQFDQFIAAQLNSASSAFKGLESYDTQISQLDNLLADAEAGLAPIMQSFFSSLQDLTGAPADPAARQGVIGTADTLSAQFRSLDNYLQDIQAGISSQLESEVTQINNTVEQIAHLNHEIAMVRAKQGEAPNTLLNQRDHLVAELSERVDVDVYRQDGDSYSITVGNGQPLVAGTESYALATMNSAEDPSRKVVGYVDSGGNTLELKPGTFEGGSMGGLMKFRSETLDTVQNHVGHMAASLALAFNEQHAQGTDLEGNPGGQFFSIGEPDVFSHGKNTGSATIDAAFDDYKGLTGVDYDLRVTDVAGKFEVTRRDTGETLTATMNGANELEFENDDGDSVSIGMTLTVQNSGDLEVGDRFQLQPTRRAAGGIENLITDTAAIAAGETSASGDNENALALQALQDKQIVGDDATLSQSYASLVSEVGNRSNVTKVNMAAQQSLTEQITQVQQSQSGVNLDEEAANLIRYQQYYQANAKVIEVGATILDTVLGIRA